MAALVGKWDFVAAENLEKYMEISGVPESLREIARKSTPNMEITESGGAWTIKTVVGDKVKETTFKLGEEFDSQSLTGAPLKCSVKMDGNVMTETQTAADGAVTITRQVEGDQLVSKMTIQNVTAVIKFKKA